jgi:hypothetical protein
MEFLLGWFVMFLMPKKEEKRGIIKKAPKDLKVLPQHYHLLHILKFTRFKTV